MGDVQPCMDACDLTELSIPQQLYLKPEAKLSLTIALPSVRLPGKTISNWEVTERLRQAVEPHNFQLIKVTKSTLEFIRFEAEIDNHSQIPTFLQILSGKVIRLSGFPEPLKVRVAEAKPDFPAKHDWDRYFRDAKNMNEMKAGERPDTVHITGLPSKWFSNKKSNHGEIDKPSEQIVQKVFQCYGEIRRVDIPMLDSYRNHMKASISGVKTFSYDTDARFEAYVQYRDYISFVRAMDALRGMKLIQKQGVKFFSASVKVDFDKTKHLSDASIQRRKIERDKLMEKERETDEAKRRQEDAVRRVMEEEQRKKQEEKRLKGERRKEREEKRKQKILRKLKRKEAEQMSIKIAIEERKLLMAQRKLESIRLLDELFERVKIERQKEVTIEKEKELENQLSKTKEHQERKLKKKEKKDLKKKEGLFDKEKELRKKLVKKIKERQEQHLEERAEKLRKTIEGKHILKSVLKSKNDQEGSSSHKPHFKNDRHPQGNYREGPFPNRPFPSHRNYLHQKESESKNDEDLGSDCESSATSKYSHLNSSTDDEEKKSVKNTWPGYEAMIPEANSSHPWVGYSDYYNPRFMRRGGRRGRGGFRGSMRGGFNSLLNPNVPINSFYMQPINDSYYRYFNKLTKGEQTGRSQSRSRSRSRSSDRVVCRKVLSRSRSRSQRSSRSRSRSKSKDSRKSNNQAIEGGEMNESELSLSLSASDGFDSPERKATPLGKKPGWEPRFPRNRDFSYDRPYPHYRPRGNSHSSRIKSTIAQVLRSRSRDKRNNSSHREDTKSVLQSSEDNDKGTKSHRGNEKDKEKKANKDQKQKKRSDKKAKKKRK